MWGAAGFVKSFLNYIIKKVLFTCLEYFLRQDIFFEKILDEHKSKFLNFLFSEIQTVP